MCQAYEAQRASIVIGEDFAAIAGFTAARRGIPKTANPHNKYDFEVYDRKAWDHGWGCFHERLLPWALERKYHEQGRTDDAQKARERFRLTGEFPKELERFLHD